MDKIRLFTALKVPPALAACLASLPRKGLQGRWIHSRDMHITLRFIGDVTGEEAQEICNALARVRAGAINIEVQGLGFFATPRQDILYADVKTRRRIEHLKAEISDALYPFDIYPVPHAFIPHITLARLKKTPRAKVITYIDRYRSLATINFKVSSFSLLRSRLNEESGRHYRTLHEYPLVE